MYLSLVSCVLLAAVAGLLLMVGFQVRQMRGALKDAPTLGDAVGQQLRMASEALQSLQKAAREESPVLEKRVREAQMASQDLTYLTQRAEEILQLLEKTLEDAAVSGVRTGVAGANVAAAREPTDPVAPDPLENLLAGLAAARADEAQVAPAKPVAKKSQPPEPTAMEVLMGVAEMPEAKPNPLRVVADMQAKRREKSQAERDLQDAVMRRAG